MWLHKWELGLKWFEKWGLAGWQKFGLIFLD